MLSYYSVFLMMIQPSCLLPFLWSILGELGTFQKELEEVRDIFISKRLRSTSLKTIWREFGMACAWWVATPMAVTICIFENPVNEKKWGEWCYPFHPQTQIEFCSTECYIAQQRLFSIMPMDCLSCYNIILYVYKMFFFLMYDMLQLNNPVSYMIK